MDKRPNKEKLSKENEAWRKGYEAGKKSNEKEARIGRAILDVLYEIFELKEEDY